MREDCSLYALIMNKNYTINKDNDEIVDLTGVKIHNINLNYISVVRFYRRASKNKDIFKFVAKLRIGAIYSKLYLIFQYPKKIKNH